MVLQDYQELINDTADFLNDPCTHGFYESRANALSLIKQAIRELQKFSCSCEEQENLISQAKYILRNHAQ